MGGSLAEGEGLGANILRFASRPKRQRFSASLRRG